MIHDARIRDLADKRRQQGDIREDTQRVVKRYIARETFAPIRAVPDQVRLSKGPQERPGRVRERPEQGQMRESRRAQDDLELRTLTWGSWFNQRNDRTALWATSRPSSSSKRIMVRSPRAAAAAGRTRPLMNAVEFHVGVY